LRGELIERSASHLGAGAGEPPSLTADEIERVIRAGLAAWDAAG
jgi:hypothetical protein